MIVPELEMELVDRIPGFQCRLCGRCCRRKLIAVYGRDLERLRGKGDFCDDTTEEERSLTGASHKMRMEEGKCVLLKDGRCAHYAERPDTCRRHPFLVTGRNILVAMTCPGVDRSSVGNPREYRLLSEGIGPGLDRYLALRSRGRRGI